ncbi:ABC transporter ATP-binding protein [Methanocella sp. MCL-LM]|uniref:ABC transporter ATP-binding protein n=1 Tax=Methanocella sp. MCL-LM TaxID=3412035 RepID=UPI003C759C4D
MFYRLRSKLFLNILASEIYSPLHAGRGDITITTKGLTKTYDGVHGIKNIDLSIRSGSCFGFIGANGAGKTTTIKILVGLLKPQAGTAIVSGYDLRAEPEKVRKIVGYLPDTYGLYDYLSGYDVVDYTARLHGFERSERKEIVEFLLKKLDLFEARNVKVGKYSKGMRQKVALARALVNDPDVLFLDEPTSGLDPVAARGIEDLIKSLTRDGKTIFITSHVLPEVEKVCDSLAIIKNGTIRASGSMDDMRRKFYAPAIRIKVSGSAAGAHKALAVLGGLGKAELADGYICIPGDRDALAPEINRRLASAGISITEMSGNSQSLEDVYFKVMGE